MKAIRTCALVALLVLFLGLMTACPTGCQNAGDCVAAASPDPTPPTVALDAHFSSGKPIISVSETSAPVTTKVGGGEVITLLAGGTDNDGGCKDIQIWVETTTWKTNPNGTVTQTGPGLLGAPAATNPDNTSKIGEQVLKKRIAQFNVENFKSPGNPATNKIRVRVWAVAVNFAGKTTQSATIEFDWP